MSELAFKPAPITGGVRQRWRAARLVAGKELLELWRDRRALWLLALTPLLMAGALAFGALQHERIDRERAAAAAADRDIWTSQGQKNPHAAAHFGQYAFKPESPLALADPGIDAYVGTAIWLVAHEQVEAQFRPARDGNVAARLGSLSLAFVLQTVMPLLAILLGFSAFSGERERGTLRQLLSVSASPLDLLAGKTLASLTVMAALLVPALAGMLLCVALSADPDHLAIADQFWRAGALALGYGLYLCGFCLLTLGVSAMVGTSRTALILLLTFWLANCFIAPRVMTDVARSAVALPTALEFRKAMADDRRKSFGHDENHPAFIAFRNEVLKKYGVGRIEDLPVNFRGLSLRKDDENGFAIYDKHFLALHTAFDKQDRIRAAPGALFPLLALQPWSTSFAGADTWHQFDFVTSAEAHRRDIQTIVSEDLIRNGGKVGSTYAADTQMWTRIPSFHYRSPGAGWALTHSVADLFALIMWCVATLAFAVVATLRLRPV
jgi:ABC-2 type transport system permease protein